MLRDTPAVDAAISVSVVVRSQTEVGQCRAELIFFTLFLLRFGFSVLCVRDFRKISPGYKYAVVTGGDLRFTREKLSPRLVRHTIASGSIGSVQIHVTLSRERNHFTCFSSILEFCDFSK